MTRAERLTGPLAAAVVGWSCGGSGPAAPAPSPTASPLTADGLPRPYNMALLAHVDLGALTAQSHPDEPSGTSAALAGSACWGYTSPDGRRFALMGTSVGLSIVEITNPASPRTVALVPGGESAWREVKTYRQYVYVTTEAKTGLDIIDMADPDRPRKVQTWNRTFTSAHTLWIDVERGLLFANGTSDGMRVLDLDPDPEDPRELGSFSAFYVHDSYARGTTLFASAIQDGFLARLDVADPANIRELSRFPTGGGVTHNSWLTRDGRYLFTTDESPGRPVEGWDLVDPSKPRKVSEYIGRAGTIPHNVMIDGDRLVISHYTEGVHMLDVRDPEHPRVLGLHDTYDGPSQGFAGAWGAYIFPGTNLVIVSDIQGGLFVVGYTGP